LMLQTSHLSFKIGHLRGLIGHVDEWNAAREWASRCLRWPSSCCKSDWIEELLGVPLPVSRSGSSLIKRAS
jgi:hypothetical protein